MLHCAIYREAELQQCSPQALLAVRAALPFFACLTREVQYEARAPSTLRARSTAALWPTSCTGAKEPFLQRSLIVLDRETQSRRCFATARVKCHASLASLRAQARSTANTALVHVRCTRVLWSAISMAQSSIKSFMKPLMKPEGCSTGGRTRRTRTRIFRL